MAVVIDPLLEMRPPEQGYCQYCHQPAKVGGLRMAGWPHTLWICVKCLVQLAAVVEKG